ncbi:hypothetical protein ACFQVC_33780 [Streptomyces monticola]|uniref:Integral membrane protein n=1 Tax=Streptomyces monticola TaxID=2666263 RepID=A0ABW2JSK8_9ACTN
MDISGTQPRMLRAALFTAVVVTLSAASHVLLSRVPLPLTTVAAVGAGVFALAYLLAGRERGYWRIASLLIPLELAADTVFTTGQHVCYGQAGGPVAGPLRAFGLDVLCGGEAVGTSFARAAGAGERPAAELLASADPAAAWLLLAAHVGVGLLAAAWLRRGESALAQLLRAAGKLAFRPLLLAVAVVTVHLEPVRRTPRPAHQIRTTRAWLFAHSVSRRGPPCPGPVFA